MTARQTGAPLPDRQLDRARGTRSWCAWWNAVLLLTERNLRIYFRDRTGVVFSLLSPLIMLGLYALFLGHLQIEHLESQLPRASRSDIGWFVNSWVFAGVVTITTVTASLSALGKFVEDRASGRLADFAVLPLRRSQLTASYLLSAFVVAVLTCAVVIVVGELYLLARSKSALGPNDLARLFAFVCLLSAAYAALASFLVTFLTTTTAFGAFSTVVGVLIGFLSGSYLPAGLLPHTVVDVIHSLPFAQSAMLVSRIYTRVPIAALAGGSERAVTEIHRFYGISARVGNITIHPLTAIAELAVLLALSSALGTWRLRRQLG